MVGAGEVVFSRESRRFVVPVAGFGNHALVGDRSRRGVGCSALAIGVPGRV